MTGRAQKTEWWGAGVVICLERDVDLHTAQLMPLPLTVSCFSEIQSGFTCLVPAHLGSPRQRAVKWVCVSMLPGDMDDSRLEVFGLTAKSTTVDSKQVHRLYLSSLQ